MTTLHIPDNTPLAQVVAFAESIGGKLRRRPDGSILIEPKPPAAAVLAGPWADAPLQQPEEGLTLCTR